MHRDMAKVHHSRHFAIIKKMVSLPHFRHSSIIFLNVNLAKMAMKLSNLIL